MLDISFAYSQNVMGIKYNKEWELEMGTSLLKLPNYELL